MSNFKTLINDRLSGSQIAELPHTLGISQQQMTRILNKPSVSCNQVAWIKMLANILGEECACDFAIQHRLGFNHKSKPLGISQMEELAQLDGYESIKINLIAADAELQQQTKSLTLHLH